MVNQPWVDANRTHIAAAALINNAVAVKGNPLTYSTQVPLSAAAVYYVFLKVQPGAFNGTPNAAAVFTSGNATLQAALQGATASSLSADKSFAVYTLAPMGAVVPVNATISFTPQGAAGSDGSVNGLAAYVNGGVINAQLSIGSAASTASVLTDVDSAAGGNIIILEGAGVSTTACPIALQPGYWWNPSEPGRGYFVEQQGNSLYFAAFMYANSGRATWYQATGTLASTNSSLGAICRFSDILYAYANGQTLNGPYVTPLPPTVAASVIIDFSDMAHATVQWGGSTTNIQRYPIVTGGLNSPAALPQTGFWWNPAEAGRGYTVEVQAGMLYYAAFMYDGSGNPIWYLTGPGSVSAQANYSGALAQFCCGEILNGTFKSASIANANVGPTTLQFTGPAAAVMTYPGGTQVPLSRYVFAQGSAGPVITVALAGNASGTVTSIPAGISCGFTCMQAYPVGTQITLTAAPSAGATFGGWNGACTGTGACVIAAGANASVGATFAVAGANAVVVNVSGPGSVISTPPAISCTQLSVANCGYAFAGGTGVTLLAAPNVDGARFGGWSGDCAGSGLAPVCTLAASGGHGVSALFYPASALP